MLYPLQVPSPRQSIVQKKVSSQLTMSPIARNSKFVITYCEFRHSKVVEASKSQIFVIFDKNWVAYNFQPEKQIGMPSVGDCLRFLILLELEVNSFVLFLMIIVFRM